MFVFFLQESVIFFPLIWWGNNAEMISTSVESDCYAFQDDTNDPDTVLSRLTNNWCSMRHIACIQHLFCRLILFYTQSNFEMPWQSLCALKSYCSVSSSPWMYRRLLRKDREPRVWECLIFTYPVTVWIRPMKLSSSDAMLSGETERERERDMTLEQHKPNPTGHTVSALTHHFISVSDTCAAATVPYRITKSFRCSFSKNTWALLCHTRKIHGS